MGKQNTLGLLMCTGLALVATGVSMGWFSQKAASGLSYAQAASLARRQATSYCLSQGYQDCKFEVINAWAPEPSQRPKPWRFQLFSEDMGALQISLSDRLLSRKG